MTDEAAADAAAAVAREAGIRWSLFYLPFDVFGEKGDFEEGLAKTRKEIPLAVRAGARVTYNHIFPGSNTRDFAANMAWHRERLARVYDVLAPMGVKYCLEFIGPATFRNSFAHPFINTLEEAVGIADSVSADIGIALDLFHFWTSGGQPGQLARLDPRRVYMIHANDGYPGRALDEQLNLARAMPMTTGLLDAPAYLRPLLVRGNDAPMFAEPFQPERGRLGTLPADAAAAEAIASLRRCLPADT